MFNIVKSLSKVEVNGKSQILVRINVTRTNRPRLKTGIFVKKEYFVNGEFVKPKYARSSSKDQNDANEAETALGLFCHRLQELLLQQSDLHSITKEWLQKQMCANKAVLPDNIPPLSPHQKPDIMDLADNVHYEEKTLYDYFDEYCRSKRVSQQRVVSYNALKRILIRYEHFERMMGNDGFTLGLSKIDEDVITCMTVYFKNEGSLSLSHPLIFQSIIKKMKEQFPYEKKDLTIDDLVNQSDNYVKHHLKNLKAVANWLSDLRLWKENPFDNIVVQECQYIAHPVFISVQERNMLKDLDLRDVPKLAVQRDIFIFQCLTGCRYGDLVQLTEENVINGTVLRYVPNKTQRYKNHVTPRVPLTNDAQAIIQRYKGRDQKGRLLPFICINRYNEAIRTLFVKAGLTRKVHILNPRTGHPELVPICDVASSHLARRTFIGNLYNKIKDPAVISAMSGHVEDSRSFSRYRDIGDDARSEIIAKIQ